MRIQHNIMAMNAYRNYNTNTSALSKNLEKLSSGYKINRAGDDAAGLAISEKMRAQITGLNAAQKNVKDGISLVKTAEGAMQEIQDMLNRMDYLATQSANGTYQDEVDRENLQKEVNQLLSEIDRIADSANFNGIKLLDGSLDPTSSNTFGGVAANAVNMTEVTNRTEAITQAVTASFEINLEGAVFAGSAVTEGVVTLSVGGATIAVTISGATSGSPFEVVQGSNSLTVDGSASVNISGVTYNVRVTNGTTLKFETTAASYADLATTASLDVSNITATITGSGLGTATAVGDAPFNFSAQNTVDGVKTTAGVEAQATFTLTKEMIDSGKITIDGTDYTFDKDTKMKDSSGTKIGIADWDGSTINDVADRLVAALNSNSNFSAGHADSTIRLQAYNATATTYTEAKAGVGLDEAGWSKNLVTWGDAKAGKASGTLQLQIGDTSDQFNQLQVKVGDMHRTALGLNDLDISTAANASASIQKIKDAINNVSSVRGDLGATQNRLEHTANNLSVMAENIQDAESTIRDTDVAEEMMAYTKNNILIQSAQAMLAQANAVPQGVLQLLG